MKKDKRNNKPSIQQHRHKTDNNTQISPHPHTHAPEHAHGYTGTHTHTHTANAAGGIDSLSAAVSFCTFTTCNASKWGGTQALFLQLTHIHIHTHTYSLTQSLNSSLSHSLTLLTHSLTLTHSLNHSISHYTGAIRLYPRNTSTVSDSVFINNTALTDGMAIMADSKYRQP